MVRARSFQARSEAGESVEPVDVAATNNVYLASMSATLRAVQEAVKTLDHRGIVTFVV